MRVVETLRCPPTSRVCHILAVAFLGDTFFNAVIIQTEVSLIFSKFR